jgi:hypothetical protein
VRRAACTYYPAWRQRFADHGLRIIPSVGDHELGDNNWERRQGGAYERFKWRAHRVFKQQWVRYVGRDVPRFSHPQHGQAEQMAYATRLQPNVLLVTMYDFTRTSEAVRPGIDRAQLRWLQGVLARAKRQGVDWVFVQGHLPVLQPVRTSHSSNMALPGGTSSPFWQLMAKYDVDAYLCGEVHATSAITADGVLQVCHGGLLYRGEASYLVGRISGRHLVLRTKAFRAQVEEGGERLWQTARRVGGSGVVYSRHSHQTGLLEMTANGQVVRRSGLLREYRPG